jgi:hypothetical protein
MISSSGRGLLYVTGSFLARPYCHRQNLRGAYFDLFNWEGVGRASFYTVSKCVSRGLEHGSE